MSDREKVIAGLMMLVDRKNDDTCEGLKCCKIAEDALALLKEQEAVEPYEAEMMITHDDGSVEYLKDIDSVMLLAHMDYQITYTGEF